ncbi:dihydroneopterin aldolase [Aliiroseovarius sp. S1123]|jgi:dihydroneopterin aldolase|uniref:dihydroneopterin aldolase n=1 Tax=unclassified Aliiroseovarius TaxID=2623558 RepID=UPI001FF4F112|nr:dihydroneopterin aldolase [Aliiroseovarius sp. S1123]MCK0169536.1 dihydroneopterin aldolase [Aliiroseovarius sp. S1123]
MTDASLAFSDLEARARTMAGDAPADRISVRDHVVDVEIGAFQAERGVTQRLSFSVVVEVADHGGADTDDVDDILSYDTITEAIMAELDAERLNLLETLAERIAQRLLLVPQPQRVFVRIEKLDRGPGKLGVEIVRDRTSGGAEVEAQDAPAPILAFLSSEALKAEALPTFLDQFEEDGAPTILIVDADLPQVQDSWAARNIVLLQADQAAWQLASIDPRTVPVGTRTELDWGLKNGQLSVWAPSKMVLDAVDAPVAISLPDLTLWFAEQVQACQILWVGCEAPDTAGIASHSVMLEDLS